MRYACISTSSKQLAIKSRINFTLNQARTSSKFQMEIDFDIDFQFQVQVIFYSLCRCIVTTVIAGLSLYDMILCIECISGGATFV